MLNRHMERMMYKNGYELLILIRIYYLLFFQKLILYFFQYNQVGHINIFKNKII
jgi:hypothetical protein